MNSMDREAVYETKFEFPLMKLVRAKAEELDISYHDALVLVKPDYVRTIHYKDEAFEEAEIAKFNKITEETNRNWEKFLEEGKCQQQKG